jgi:hypothetical protein
MKQTASPSKTAKTPTSKHTPIMPKGTKFRWEDNMKYWNIKKGSAFNLDTVTPQNLIITLTSIDGKVRVILIDAIC